MSSAESFEDKPVITRVTFSCSAMRWHTPCQELIWILVFILLVLQEKYTSLFLVLQEKLENFLVLYEKKKGHDTDASSQCDSSVQQDCIRSSTSIQNRAQGLKQVRDTFVEDL